MIFAIGAILLYYVGAFVLFAIGIAVFFWLVGAILESLTKTNEEF